MVHVAAARREDEGAIAILVAVFALVMFGFAAIVVDLGDARSLRALAQDTADSAALAGASKLAEGGSIAEADAAVRSYALDNMGTTSTAWATCSRPVPAGWSRPPDTSCIQFHDFAASADMVRVSLPSEKSVVGLGAMFGYQGISVSATTQAQVRDDDPIAGCGLCVLTGLDTRGSVTVRGGDSFSARTGRVRTAGADNGFVEVQDGGSITFASTPNPGTGPYSPDPVVTGSPADPFAGALMPSFPAPAPTNVVTCGSGPGQTPTLPAATYQNIDVRGPCTAAGTVAVTGHLHVFSSGSLSSASVTLYFACGNRSSPTACSAQNGGRLTVDAGGDVTISGGTASPFTLLADPGNIRNNWLTVNGSVTLSAPLYARLADVTLGATAQLFVGSRTVVDNLTVARDGTVLVTSSGASAVPGPIDVRLLK